MIKRPLDYYKALYRIAGELDSGVAVEKELAVLVESAANVLAAKGCSILMLTEDQKKLVHMASYGLSNSYIRKGLVELDSITAETLKGKPIIVKDATNDPGVQYPAQAKKEGIVSMASVPLILKGKVAGILRVYTNHPTDFSVEDIAFLSSVGNLGATAISRDQIYRAVEQHFQNILMEKTEELSELAEAKDKLIESISVIAHDLKSPLAAIQSYFSVLLGGYAGELNEKQRQMIERSSLRIHGLLKLISDLLDLSRIEMGQITQEMEQISLAKILEGSLEEVHGLTNGKDITLAVDIQPEIRPIYGSSIRLQQVFANLLGNAVKFIPNGGTISLKLSELDDKILCKIQDTGIGIPDEDIPHIFEDFYRASNVEKGSGTGLGLSIVRRIVDAHKGEIWVESPCRETGVGTEFSFTLPISESVQIREKKKVRKKRPVKRENTRHRERE